MNAAPPCDAPPPPARSSVHRHLLRRSVCRPVAASAVLPALLLAGACAPDDGMFRPVRAETMRDAGSVHLSVLSVAPWSKYVAALTPKFNLEADQALAQVARDSRWMDEHQKKSARLGSEPVLIGRDGQGGVNSVYGPPMQLPQGESLLNRDGHASVPRYDSGRSGGGMADLNPGAPAAGPDAMLQYTAATALFQEVQLLNRYIEDAAIPNGFRPYVVRLQISLMPSRRHAPYDAYTTISFFTREPDRAGSLPESGRPGTPFGDGPRVLPLIVTDNLEASVNRRSLDRMLGIYFGHVDFPPGTERFVSPLYEGLLSDSIRNEVAGRDLNSLLTLARLSENTVRIRLGAMQETSANYAMVPRNHNITMLLMIPEGAPALAEVVCKTVLVDTTTGQPLRGSDDIDVSSVSRVLGRSWNLRDLDQSALEHLIASARRNDQNDFFARLHRALPPGHQLRVRDQALWIELVSLMVGDEFSSQVFELPGQEHDLERSTDLFNRQTVVAEDDGQAVRIVLRQARFPESAQIIGVLTTGRDERPSGAADGGRSGPGRQSGADASDDAAGTSEDGVPLDSGSGDGATTEAWSTPHADPIVILAESVKIDNARRELRLTFPSLVRLQLGNGDHAADPLMLQVRWGGQSIGFRVLHRQVSPATSFD